MLKRQYESDISFGSIQTFRSVSGFIMIQDGDFRATESIRVAGSGDSEQCHIHSRMGR
jgi:hypothetical protein